MTTSDHLFNLGCGDRLRACVKRMIIGQANDADSVSPASVELSILMPCLNEAETLQVCIEKAQRFLREHNVRGEVVIADNGSTDGSQEIARKAGARVVAVAARGYGSALGRRDSVGHAGLT